MTAKDQQIISALASEAEPKIKKAYLSAVTNGDYSGIPSAWASAEKERKEASDKKASEEAKIKEAIRQEILAEMAREKAKAEGKADPTEEADP